MELDQLHEGFGHELSKDPSLEGTQPRTTLTRETAQRQRVAAAARMGSLASAAHHAAGDLEAQFPQTARHVSEAAIGFERISGLLRDPNLDEVASLIGNLSPRQPAAIVAGIVLLGLGLSWFLGTPGGAASCSTMGEAEGGAYGIR
jgi:hypothetical protein